MASRYYHQDDDRELDAPPVSVACEACRRLFPVAEEDADDETQLCLACVNATVSQPMSSAGWDEDLWF